jgi:uncharacterized protein YifE (UPF0438 family)
MPITSCSQSLPTVNPRRPEGFRERWTQIRASYSFEPAEEKKLKKYGPWLHALYNAELRAKSAFEIHFVSVCSGQTVPINDIEAIWQMYIFCQLADTQRGRLDRGQLDYPSVREAMEEFASEGNPFASDWLAKEGPWTNERNNGHSNRLWRDGPIWKVVEIVEG